MSPTARRALQVAISLVLAGGLLAFFLSRVDLSEIGRRIAQASPAWLGLALVIAMSTFALRALRWTWMLRPIARVSFWSAFFATAVGFATTRTPARRAARGESGARATRCPRGRRSDRYVPHSASCSPVYENSMAGIRVAAAPP